MKLLLKIWFPLVAAIVVSYYWIDRPLCDFVFYHSWPQDLSCLNSDTIFHGGLMQRLFNLKDFIAGWPPLMTSLAPFIFFAAFLFKPGKLRSTLLLMSLSIMLVFLFKNDLKWVFSRYWPLTWVNNNISWVTNHAYGFQWFQGAFFQASDDTGSFPSGHSAIAFATFLPIGLIYRSTLCYCISLAVLECIAMIVFDFHFLSDVFAGVLVGITSVLAVKSVLVSRDPSPVS